MNWKKLTIGITLVNLLAWALVELWSCRYADSNIAGGTAFLIGLHIVGYYIIIISSRVPAIKPTEPDKYKPHNCPGHQWHKSKYGLNNQQCIVCGAERGE